jgi:hypothetical protein
VGAGEGALCFKEDIPAEDDAAVLVNKFHGGGTDDVSGRMQDDFNLVLALGMDFAALEALAIELTGKDGDIAVQEERKVGIPVFFALALHDVDGIAQHAGSEEGVGQTGDDGGVGVLR